MPALIDHAVAWSVVIPLAAATFAWLLARRFLPAVVLVSVPLIALAVGGVVREVWRAGPLRYAVGGWGAPLGIDYFVDGLGAVMLAMTAVVGVFVSLYALSYFGDEERPPRYFWSSWFLLWAALNALFVSADIFNLYVTLELLTLASAALVTLAGVAALGAGLRYLLAALAASLCFLLGVAFLYGNYGTLDIALLRAEVAPGPAVAAAVSLMTLGLLLKSALFPLHFWLPSAHAAAPAPVSAALSALVVKATFYLLLRLWFDAFPAALVPAASQVLGVLGALAIVWGSVQALRAARLKLLIAYSTVAQVGYLFLLFPLALASPQSAGASVIAWEGGVFQALSHAFAKSAMFLAAGTVLHSLDHDRVTGIGGMVAHTPVTVFAFGLAGVSLMGLPPSGGFIAKWLLLSAALDSGRWWWALVVVAGGLLAAAYVLRVLRRAFFAQVEEEAWRPVSRTMELAPLALALCALALGFASAGPLALLRIGAPLAMAP